MSILFRNASCFCYSVDSQLGMLIFVAFASAISGKTWKSLSKEKKLLALVRVEKSHFAGLLTSPSVVDKQTSSSAAGVVAF